MYIDSTFNAGKASSTQMRAGCVEETLPALMVESDCLELTNSFICSHLL